MQSRDTRALETLYHQTLLTTGGCTLSYTRGGAHCTTIIFLKVVTDLKLQPPRVPGAVLSTFKIYMNRAFCECYSHIARHDCEMTYVHQSSDTLLSQSVEVDYAPIVMSVPEKCGVTFFQDMGSTEWCSVRMRCVRAFWLNHEIFAFVESSFLLPAINVFSNTTWH
ncbi:unnamed protein product [Trypanosoma congolense IL3000]|uniref:WGS project CAEQ00000000 data, annotated contig 1131 n=1 Tax=Trypanosoma congolense (strain IL3000) TaxID=1068625 RepID=F9W400_TRYCI|nr:unnamed protein product [Trypanosoma congolense IL3000]